MDKFSQIQKDFSLLENQLLGNGEEVQDAFGGIADYVDELRAENGRLWAELEEAQEQWRIFASMMIFEPYDCICLEPPDEDENPSAHSQYCPIYLEAYARAMADGTELPE